MSPLPVAAATPIVDTGPSVGTPAVWAITIAAILALLALDFAITRRPHAVSMREAVRWSVFYVALPLLFGLWILSAHGSEVGLEYYTGYLVEKSLSIDNLFVFMLIISAFAVPAQLQQRVLFVGIIGALVLRAIFIALGAQLLTNFAWMFLVFGLVLVGTGVKILRDTRHGGHAIDVDRMRSVALLRRVYPVTDDFRGGAFSVREAGKRSLTPLALVAIALLATDLVFAIDSVPAVYGITGDPYLVFVTNAFALLGLRALYFVLQGSLSKLVHLGYGMAAILAFIGTKLVLHWAHGVWSGVPEISTILSLVVIVAILATVTVTSLLSRRE